MPSGVSVALDLSNDITCELVPIPMNIIREFSASYLDMSNSSTVSKN